MTGLALRGSAVLERLLRWRAFPGAVQWPLVVVVALLVVASLRVPRHAELNPGAAVVWQLWWAVLPFVILLTARLWCAVCPFPALGDAVQRFRTAPLPPPALRRGGPWAAALGLGALGVLFLLLHVETSGPLTGALLVAFAAAVIGAAFLWQRRAWCRYLCPLGLMVGLYSRLGWLRLGTRDGGRESAATARDCPVFSSALAARRAHDCVLCGVCLRERGGAAVEVRVGRPSPTAPSLTAAEAVAVSMLLGLLLADALRMIPVYLGYMAWAVGLLGGRYEIAMALGIGAVMAAVLVVHAAAARVLGGGETFAQSFARLSLLWLPVVLAAHLALSAQHLLAAGDVLQNLGAELGLVRPGHMPPAEVYASVWPMKALQGAMLALGALAALFLVRRLVPGRQGYAWGAAGVLPALPLVVIFVQPMTVAC
jgi:hypothetical protein